MKILVQKYLWHKPALSQLIWTLILFWLIIILDSNYKQWSEKYDVNKQIKVNLITINMILKLDINTDNRQNFFTT